jgi:hypothetical protein
VTHGVILHKVYYSCVLTGGPQFSIYFLQNYVVRWPSLVGKLCCHMYTSMHEKWNYTLTWTACIYVYRYRLVPFGNQSYIEVLGEKKKELPL